MKARPKGHKESRPGADPLEGLPGEDLVRDGLADLQAGRWTVPGCLVAIGLPRLRRGGLAVPEPPTTPADPELRLYRLLRQAGGDAYSRYNALLRRLVSFENALERRQRRADSGAPIPSPRPSEPHRRPKR